MTWFDANVLSNTEYVTPTVAYMHINASQTHKMLDVRSFCERKFVGRPVLPDGQYHQAPLFPDNGKNFNIGSPLLSWAIDVLTSFSQGDTVYSMCRSASRSKYGVVLTHLLGFQSKEVLGGFQGNKLDGKRYQFEGLVYENMPHVIG